MAAISDYLEKQLLEFIFRGSSSFLGHSNIPNNPAFGDANIPYGKPSNISIALLNTVPGDDATGATMDEVVTSNTNEGGATIETLYDRVSLGSPASQGNSKWSDVGVDTASAYYVHTEVVADSGFWYPLYLNSTSVTGTVEGPIVFAEDFPGVEFYAPANDVKKRETDNPDPQEIIYKRYDGNGFIQNNTTISFPQAGQGGWGTISAIAIMDSATVGEGNILFYSALETAKTVGRGDIVQFIPSSLEISVK